MKFAELETVILTRDLADSGLRAGDLGAIVTVDGSDALEVEFVTAGGRTQALVTLREADVRKVAPEDMLTVRSAKPAA
jgi:hypothetical protein